MNFHAHHWAWLARVAVLISIPALSELFPVLAVEAANQAKTAAESEVSFNRDLAPVIFRHCAPCHRPGGTGPFSLLNYGEAAKRAKEMAEVTAQRLMPPWLPAPGQFEWVDSRRMRQAEVELFQRWLALGAPEGDARNRPPAPTFPGGWQLGTPDLVAQMPEPYELGPEG